MKAIAGRTALLLVAGLLATSPALAGGLEVGAKVPDFTLMSHEGKKVSLSDFEGKTVVLEWFNPECPFVKRHYVAGTMKGLAEQYSENDVVWLAVNSTHWADPGDMAKFCEKEKLSYAVLMDNDGTVGRAYGAKTTPHMFVVGPDQTLLYQGAIDDDRGGKKEEPFNYVNAALQSVSAGQKIERAETKPYGCSVKYGEPTKAKDSTSTSR